MRIEAILTVAGRTDAGVHATGQVAHLDVPPGALPPDQLAHRLARLLPPDLRVPAVRQVPRSKASSRMSRSDNADMLRSLQ